MNNLHRPLSGPKSAMPSRTVVTWASIGLGVVLLSLTAYLLIDRQPADRQVVSLDDSKVVASRETGKANPEPASPSKPLVVDENGNIDLSSVKPLSPLDPLDPEDEAASPPKDTQAFKPKPSPPKRLSEWVPLPDLVENSQYGPLPKISDGGLRPLDAYSQSSGMVGANRIALVVGGLGLSQTGTQKAIESLPPEITLGFSPFGNSLQRWMQSARKQGHEVVLQLPMEPLGYPTIDPGPRTLTSKASDEENIQNLRWLLGRMTNYPLVMNYLGAQFSNKPDRMEPVLNEIRNRGLGYIDDGSVINSQSIPLAKDMRLPNVRGSITIDSVRDPVKILANLKNLEAMARQKGFVMASATAFPETIEVISKWSKNAQKRGIHIVPASNLLKDYAP